MKHRFFRHLLHLLPLFGGACGSNETSTSPAAHLVINEIMPANKTTCADPLGVYSDWVELYNPGDQALDLAGYSVSDNPAEPRKAILAEGLSVAPKAVLLLWADDVLTGGPTHLPFKLAKDGEQIALFDPSSRKLDEFAWTATQADVSYGRAPDGTGAFVTCVKPTCGALNGTACMK